MIPKQKHLLDSLSMKKVELHTIEKQANNDLYRIAYYVDGKLYVKWNVGINLYGYTFDVDDGVDDFNISLNVIKGLTNEIT